jgi:hypothetical protein
LDGRTLHRFIVQRRSYAPANAGHSPTVWRTGQIDPKHAFKIGPHERAEKAQKQSLVRAWVEMAGN